MKSLSPDFLRKINPKRAPQMSGKMTSILGYICGQRWSSPVLAEIQIQSGGHLFGRREDDIGFNEVLGSQSDLERNLIDYINGIDETSSPLTVDERALFFRLVVGKIENANSWGSGIKAELKLSRPSRTVRKGPVRHARTQSPD